MERYSWMILLAVIAGVALIGFFVFFFKDMEFIKKMKEPKTSLWINFSLFFISVLSIILSIYLYYDIQTQLQLLERIS
ncbi:hypothetical protein [Candidatus Enterococcus ferrettii]|uniref:Uncharacterized protein n=1 Tax=Candidatus Enterococcus ferrettii TaxID=2815324 RepID=A0ABV0EN07_9ENTE|nr:hypothetical protein [Enterococcus sp. 665A]MBO1340907.1 hypothetical protein [Enterococcus sp. 665A]